MTALQYVVVAFAAYRITRFLVKDSLIGFAPDSGSAVSARVDQFAYAENGADRSFLRGKIGDLLTCTWCLGFWVSAATYTAAAVALDEWSGQPLVWHGVSIFAVAGLQGLLNTRLAA